LVIEADSYPPTAIVNRPMGFGRAREGVIKAGKSKEAILGRSGIIWTIVGVLLIIALLIYIF
jgi:hypothetical protein